MPDDSGKTDLSDVCIALFSQKIFWYFLGVAIILVGGYASFDTIAEVGERWIRAFKCMP